MKRRRFLLSTLLAFPMAAFAKVNNFFRSKTGIKVNAGDDRFEGTLKPGGVRNAIKVSGQDTDGDICIVGGEAGVVGPQTHPMHVGPPLHMHLNQDEIFYVLEGEFLIQVGDEKFNCKRGDTIFAPRQVPHAFVNTGDQPGNMITIFQPAGKMEDFFRKLDKYFVEHKGPPEMPVFRQLFEDHDMKLLGPPLQVS